MEKGQAPMLFPYEPERFWGQIRAIIKEELATTRAHSAPKEHGEQFLPRIEVAKMLHVSLVTLNSWVKKGMPAHKQQGKVYFIQSEVMDYIKTQKVR